MPEDEHGAEYFEIGPQIMIWKPMKTQPIQFNLWFIHPDELTDDDIARAILLLKQTDIDLAAERNKVNFDDDKMGHLIPVIQLSINSQLTRYVQSIAEQRLKEKPADTSTSEFVTTEYFHSLTAAEQQDLLAFHIPEDEVEYYLCSQAVIDHFDPAVKSKPFLSGYESEKDRDDFMYVAVLSGIEQTWYYDNVIEPYNKLAHITINFWFTSVSPGTMDVSKITLKDCRKYGLCRTIENDIGLTKLENVAMCIHGLAREFGCSTPIEFINKITTLK